MTIVVEDGTIVADANSYVSEAELSAFATARGITLVLDTEILLIRAMDFIEGLLYKGSKLTYAQLLQWPRSNVIIDGYYLTANTIPEQLKNGLIECAIAIDQGTDPLNDIVPNVRRKRADVLEIEYATGAKTVPVNRRILNALWKILFNGLNGSNVIGVSKG